MILYLKVVKGRGGRWRWFLEDEDGRKAAYCTGSFASKQGALLAGSSMASANIIVDNDPKDEPAKRPWYSWLFR